MAACRQYRTADVTCHIRTCAVIKAGTDLRPYKSTDSVTNKDQTVIPVVKAGTKNDPYHPQAALKILHFKDQISIRRHWPQFFIHDHFQLIHRNTECIHSRNYLIMVAMGTFFCFLDDTTGFHSFCQCHQSFSGLCQKSRSLRQKFCLNADICQPGRHS